MKITLDLARSLSSVCSEILGRWRREKKYRKYIKILSLINILFWEINRISIDNYSDKSRKRYFGVVFIMKPTKKKNYKLLKWFIPGNNKGSNG